MPDADYQKKRVYKKRGLVRLFTRSAGRVAQHFGGPAAPAAMELGAKLAQHTTKKRAKKALRGAAGRVGTPNLPRHKYKP